MFLPGPISGNSAMICAAWPDEQAMPPTAPSSAATRVASAATVGFVSRE
jgi:hypothetical protein